MTEAERTYPRRTSIGFVFQNFKLLRTLSVRNNIRIIREIAGRGRELDNTVMSVLRVLGIHREQQRVAVDRAIVNHPGILLADESTGNLNSRNSRAVLQVPRDPNENLGQTILMVTYDSEAAAYARRTVKMCDGRNGR